jgi:hypothetical protein
LSEKDFGSSRRSTSSFATAASTATGPEWAGQFSYPRRSFSGSEIRKASTRAAEVRVLWSGPQGWTTGVGGGGFEQPASSRRAAAIRFIRTRRRGKEKRPGLSTGAFLENSTRV